MTQVRKDVLNGWKEIAAYLGRDPRTVERWEKQRSLPVRRLPGGGRATVYALVPELDAWLAGAVPEVAEPAPVAEPRASTDADASPLQTLGVAPQHPGDPNHAALTGQQPANPQAPGKTHSWAMWSGIVLLVVVSLGLFLRGRTGSAHGPASATGPNARSANSSPVPGVEDLYLRGSYQTELRTPESLHKAESAFQEAIARDPDYAPAYAGLGSTYVLLREYSVLPDAEAYAKAKQAASKALLLDPALPSAHAVLGFVDFFWDWDGKGAETEFLTACKLEPRLAMAHHWYGSMLVHEGRFRDGLRELNTAQKLEPSSSAILTTRALALGLSGHPEQGSELLQEAISSQGGKPFADPATMHQVLYMLNLLPPRDLPRALAEASLAAQLRRDAVSVVRLRRASDLLNSHGEQAMWRAMLRSEQEGHPGKGPTYAAAAYKAQLGARNESLDDLSKLYLRHDAALIGISVDPLLLDLHREPGYLQLRSAMGLPKADWD